MDERAHDIFTRYFYIGDKAIDAANYIPACDLDIFHQGFGELVHNQNICDKVNQRCLEHCVTYRAIHQRCMVHKVNDIRY